MRTELHSRLYEWSSLLLLPLLRTRRPAAALTRLAKIWLRHARLVGHLARGGYDSVVDGGAGIGEFAALVRLASPKTPLLCVEPHPASARRLRFTRPMTVHSGTLTKASQQVEAAKPATMDAMAPARVMRRE